MRRLYLTLFLCTLQFPLCDIHTAWAGPSTTPRGTAAAESFRYEGFTRPSEQLPLEAYIDGILKTLHVQAGDKFKSGDVLVSLDDSIQATAVEVARLRSESVAEIRVAEARVAEAEIELESQVELAKTSAATPRDVRRAKAALAVAEAELDLARENKQLAEMQYKIEKERLDLYTIRAPFDGEVVRLAIEEGAGEGTALRQNDPIMLLAQLDPILADISLPEQVVKRLKVGQLYPLQVGSREAPVPARVKTIASVADRASQLIEVVFEIDNAAGTIRGGVRCHLVKPEAVPEQAE